MERLNLFMFTLLTMILFAKSQDPKVSTSLGDIIGRTITKPLEEMQSLQHGDKIYREVNEYLGIPFAQPPTGERRFQRPKMLTNLTSPFNAQSHGAVCLQIPGFYNVSTFNMSEDCLFLNVYVPVRPADDLAGHAVMVWIHGGGFQEGAARFEDGGNMALAGNIIVVTINYRLGVFGFLSTGDSNAPGNVGLWDQHLAFQWVAEHISAFGGDNKRVTIAGESAGAMSVIQHGLIPENRGLFQRIIAQSGSTAMALKDFEHSAVSDTLTVANMLKCNTDSMDKLLNCLRDVSADTLLSTIRALAFRVDFSPLVDGDLVKTNPQKIAKKSENSDEVDFLRSLDILSGFNAYEGAFLWAYPLNTGPIEFIQPTRDQMKTWFLPFMLKRIYRREFKSETIKVVEAQYTNWANPNDSSAIRLEITRLLGDSNFGVAAIETARLHKKSTTSRNFMYHFKPKPSVITLDTPSWIPGSNHMDELPFMFGLVGKLGVGEDYAWEKGLASQMVTYWTNFIKSGNPNMPVSITPNWPEYSLENGDFLRLEKSMSNSSAGQHFYAEETNFWLDLFPQLADIGDVDKKNCSTNISSGVAATLPANLVHSLVLMIILSFVTLT